MYNPKLDSPYLEKRAKKAGVSVEEIRKVYRELGAKKSPNKGFGSDKERAKLAGERGRETQKQARNV